MRIIFFFFLVTSSLKAAVLENGNGYFYSSLSYSTSSALWLRGDEKHDYSGSDILGTSTVATRSYYQAGVNGYYGLGYNFQLGVGLKYGIVHLSNAPILGAAKGDTRSQISEISIEGAYEILRETSWNLIGGLRYLHPGKQGRHHPEFLSFNDFTSYLEAEIRHSWNARLFDLYSLLKFKKTLTSIGNDHLSIEEKAYYKFTDKFSFGLGIDYLKTFGGLDIAGSQFNQSFAQSGFLPVWNKKESWLGATLLGAYDIDGSWQVDSYLHRKIIGKNTDISTTFGFGIGRDF